MEIGTVSPGSGASNNGEYITRRSSDPSADAASGKTPDRSSIRRLGVIVMEPINGALWNAKYLIGATGLRSSTIGLQIVDIGTRTDCERQVTPRCNGV